MNAAEYVSVRSETPDDRDTIRFVNEAAFGRPAEADLVDRLRAEGSVLASFVADIDRRVVGHILFSRMLIETECRAMPAVALAPVAVLPPEQQRGIGGRLIRHGLEWLRAADEQIVIVVGHPAYYPRFGFSTVRARALVHPFPAEAFMALELAPGALDGIRGAVRYPDAFGL